MTTTDDTRQRSVAEIMGWRRGPDVDLDWGYLHTKPSPGRRRITVQPTDEPQVDDMLAWLIVKGVHVSAMWHDPGEGFFVELHGFDGGDRLYETSEPAPTLHAALEAAVRAVAEVSDE